MFVHKYVYVYAMYLNCVPPVQQECFMSNVLRGHQMRKLNEKRSEQKQTAKKKEDAERVVRHQQHRQFPLQHTISIQYHPFIHSVQCRCGFIKYQQVLCDCT